MKNNYEIIIGVKSAQLLIMPVPDNIHFTLTAGDFDIQLIKVFFGSSNIFLYIHGHIKDGVNL